jgi:hypothetical protein
MFGELETWKRKPNLSRATFDQKNSRKRSFSLITFGELSGQKIKLLFDVRIYKVSFIFI